MPSLQEIHGIVRKKGKGVIMKRKLSLLLVLILLFCALPVTVSANSPAVEPMYWFEFTNLPEGTKYVDMLIEMTEDDENYVALVSENLPYGFSENAPIVIYCKGNFPSYTFHYANAKSMIEIDGDGAVYFFKDDPESNALYEHEQDIYERGKIRLAMLDAFGNILQVSRTFSIKPTSIFDYQMNTFHYDAWADTLEIDVMFHTTAMAWFFWTNVLSQILMRSLHILLYGWVFSRYVFTVVVLEILVYSGEYLFYRIKMKDMPHSRVLWYTITANTLSLVLSAIPMMIV